MDIEKNKNNQMVAPDLNRRKLVCGLVGVAGLSMVPSPLLAALPKSQLKQHMILSSKPARSLAFENLHTGEKTKLVYWEKGRYVKGALKEVNRILRDHRTNEVTRMDVKLLDHLFVLRDMVDSNRPFQIISGYRSPKTNAKLRRRSGGVAKKSLHMQGRAIDINLEDVRLTNIKKAAIDMHFGGVGYYPKSQFIHVDTGHVRNW